MKRKVNALQKDRGDAERDARMREQLKADAEAEERLARVSQATSAKAKAINGLREQWKNENIKVASKFALGKPSEDPLGMCSQIDVRSRFSLYVLLLF